VLLSQLLLAAGNQEVDSLREARDTIVSRLGPDSREALEADESLARAYADFGRYQEGEQLMVGALERRRRRFGPDHPDTWRATSQLAHFHKLAGKHDLATSMYQDAIAGLEPSLSPDDPDVLSTKVGLSGSYLELRRYRETQVLLGDVIDRLRRVHGTRGFQTLVALHNLACADANLGQVESALGHLGEAIESGWNYPFGPARDPQLFPLHGDPRFDALDRAGRLNDRGFWSAHFFDAEARLREGRFAEAEPMLNDLIAATDRGGGREATDSGRFARLALARCWIRQGRFDEAESLLLPMHKDGTWRRIYDLLAQCDLGRGRLESALARIAESAAITGKEFENVEVLYLEAEVEALRGRDQAALGILARAAELGFEDADRLEHDLAFVTLRSQAEFKAIVQSARAHAL
jgi:tetratricopeptide (TPR) repeat protein